MRQAINDSTKADKRRLSKHLRDLTQALDRVDNIIMTHGKIGSVSNLPAEISAELRRAQVRNEITSQPALSHYLGDYSTIEEPEEVIIARARAHQAQLAATLNSIERSRRAMSPLAKLFHVSTAKLLLPILIGISIPSLVMLITADNEVQAYKEQQAFLANYAMTKELVTSLSKLQEEIQRLHGDLVFQEKSEGHVPEPSARLYLRRANSLLQRYQAIVDPIKMGDSTSLLEAKLTAELELDALISCLSIDYLDESEGSRLTEDKKKELRTARDAKLNGIEEALHKKIDDDLEPRLGSDQTERLKSSLRVSHPCGPQFNPYSFRLLTYEVAQVLWETLGHNVFIEVAEATEVDSAD